MPRLSGPVMARGAPVEKAYVQIQNLTGDFQGEVRTDSEGKFVLYPVRGRWRFVSWLRPGRHPGRRVQPHLGGGPDHLQPGNPVRQLTSDTDVLAAAAQGIITLTDTEEFYRCSVVGPK